MGVLLVYETGRCGFGFGDIDDRSWGRDVVHSRYTKVVVDGGPYWSSLIDIGAAVKLQGRRYTMVLAGSI